MMYTLKSSSLFRPSSRPSSPHPVPPPHSHGEPELPTDRASRPTSKLSLSSFRKASPSPLQPAAQTALVQDGSYLEALGLRLSEAVTKALAPAPSSTNPGEVLNGKRPIPAGRGRTLGSVITAELNASKGNVHLQRAVLRSLQKPLSVLLTNLSTQLLPLLSSPAFLNPPAPTVANPNLNVTQTHALAVANFAGELLDVLDELELDRNHDVRGDGLNNLREGLVSLIGRVVNPLVAGLKNEITPILQALEEPAQSSSMTATAPKAPAGAKVVTQQHPSIVTLQAVMPAFSKALTRYTVSSCCQTTLATLLISIVWRAIVSLAYRPTPPRSRANSVASTGAAASAAIRKRLGASTTPPTTPPASRFTMKLPSSRPPSPVAVLVPTAADDARVVFDLLNTLPKPMPSNDVNRVAREAVDEAFEALAALSALLAALENQEGPEVREDFDLELLTDGLPVLIALPVLLRWAGLGEPHTIPIMLGIAESEYKDNCLSGFGRAEECAGVVVQRMMEIVGNAEEEDDPRSLILKKFLESNLGNDGSN